MLRLASLNNFYKFVKKLYEELTFFLDLLVKVIDVDSLVRWIFHRRMVLYLRTVYSQQMRVDYAVNWVDKISRTP